MDLEHKLQELKKQETKLQEDIKNKIVVNEVTDKQIERLKTLDEISKCLKPRAEKAVKTLNDPEINRIPKLLLGNLSMFIEINSAINKTIKLINDIKEKK